MPLGINKNYFDNEYYSPSYFSQPYFGILNTISVPYVDRINFNFNLDTEYRNNLFLNTTSEKDLVLNKQINFEVER